MTRSKKSNSFSAPAAAGEVRHGFFHSLIFRESIIFILTVVFFGFFAFIGIDMHHDGVMLIPALRVSDGGILFRDVFYQYGLFVPLFQGMAVALFGGELLVIRLLTVLFYGGSAVLLDLLWKRFLPSKISWLTPVFFCIFSSCTMVTFHSWSSVYSLFFMLLSGLFMIRYFEKTDSSRWELFFAGISAALTWGCRTPCGAVTVFAALLVLLGLNWFCGKSSGKIWRETGCFFAGFAVVAIFAFGYIFSFGAFADFIKQNFGYVGDFAFERGGNGSWQYFCNSLFPFYQDDLMFSNAFFAFLPLCAMIILYLLVREGLLAGKEEMCRKMPLAALLIFALGSWHQYYPVPCVRHLFWGGAPLFGAFLLALSGLFAKKSLLRYGVGIFLILVAIWGVLPRGMGIWMRADVVNRSTADIPGIRYLRLSRHEAAMVKIIKEWESIGKKYGIRNMVNWSEDSLFSLMVDSSGFSDRQFYRMAGLRQYPDYDHKILEYLKNNPSMVLVDHDAFIPGYQKISEVDYIGRHYSFYLPLK